jgi:hypothetical protein
MYGRSDVVHLGPHVHPGPSQANALSSVLPSAAVLLRHQPSKVFAPLTRLCYVEALLKISLWICEDLNVYFALSGVWNKVIVVNAS